MDRQEFEVKKRALEFKKLVRKDRLEAAGDYLGFAVQKISAGALAAAGAADMVDPAFLPHIHQPQVLLAGGLAWLGGKSVLSLVVKMINSAGVK